MDVIRFLRKDDEELKPLRQLLCQWEIMQRHLLPLLTHYRNDRDLVMQIGKLYAIFDKNNTLTVDTSSLYDSLNWTCRSNCATGRSAVTLFTTGQGSISGSRRACRAHGGAGYNIS